MMSQLFKWAFFNFYMPNLIGIAGLILHKWLLSALNDKAQ